MIWLPRPSSRRLTLSVNRGGFDEIDEGPQRGGHEAAAGVIEERPEKTQPPRFEHRFEFDMRAQPVLEMIHDTGTDDRRRGLRRARPLL
jgi:hypothetical protein